MRGKTRELVKIVALKIICKKMPYEKTRLKQPIQSFFIQVAKISNIKLLQLFCLSL